MTTLGDFLLQRIAEDEASARYEYVLAQSPDRFPLYHEGRVLFPGTGSSMPMPREQYNEMIRAQYDVKTEVSNPRLLADCEMKRRMIDESEGALRDGLLRLFAFSYRDHPDYDESWRP